MEYRRNGFLYSTARAEYIGKEVIVIIDGSKTNSCMFVANKYGRELDYYELSGDSKDEIFLQCDNEREFLKTLFSGAKVIMGGIEDVITKEEGSEKEVHRGMREHETRVKLTSIFCNFIFYFQDYHRIQLELINNKLWKAKTLPLEFRTGIYANDKKGSLAYHKSIRSKYSNCKDDVTDAYQMLQFFKMEHNLTGEDSIISGDKELTSHKNLVGIYNTRVDVAGAKQFICDSEGYELKDIVAFITNRLNINEVGYCIVPTSFMSVKEIYVYCTGSFQQKEDELMIVVRRGS